MIVTCYDCLMILGIDFASKMVELLKYIRQKGVPGRVPRLRGDVSVTIFFAYRFFYFGIVFWCIVDGVGSIGSILHDFESILDAVGSILCALGFMLALLASF